MWGAKKLTLLQAVESGKTFLVDYICRKKQPNTSNPNHAALNAEGYGTTPLMLACERVNPGMISLLL